VWEFKSGILQNMLQNTSCNKITSDKNQLNPSPLAANDLDNLYLTTDYREIYHHHE
jgi:hypothetical protein